MNAKFLLLTIAIVTICSCTTAYKSGQTPDDVYFSPARNIEENKTKDTLTTARQESSEERQIRMGINDYRFRNLDYDCNYSPYKYGYNYGYYYNPYYYPYPVYNNTIKPNPSKPTNTTPRTSNLSSYNNGYNNTNTPVKHDPKLGTVTPVKHYNNNNTDPKIYNTTNNNSNNNNSNTTRSYTPSTEKSNSNNSSSSGSTKSGSSVTRPSKNNQ